MTKVEDYQIWKNMNVLYLIIGAKAASIMELFQTNE